MTDTEAIAHLVEHEFVLGYQPLWEVPIQLGRERWATVFQTNYWPSVKWRQANPGLPTSRVEAKILGPPRRDQCPPDLWNEIKRRNAEMIASLPEPFCYPKCVSDVLKHCT
jgi:hypothetical protein